MTSRRTTKRVLAVSLLTAACALSLVALPREAHAQMGPRIEKGLFLPVGLNLGYSLNTAKGTANGFLFGGETSVAFFKEGIWTGAYADVLRDFGEQETRTSLGLEAGYGPVGVDFGYLGAFRDEVAHGIRIRGILTASAISVYGGYARTWTDARTHAEFGVLLKVPLPIFVQEVKRPEPPAPPLPYPITPEPLATPPADGAPVAVPPAPAPETPETPGAPTDPASPTETKPTSPEPPPPQPTP